MEGRWEDLGISSRVHEASLGQVDLRSVAGGLVLVNIIRIRNITILSSEEELAKKQSSKNEGKMKISNGLTLLVMAG